MHLHSTKKQAMWNTFADATKKRDAFTLGLYTYIFFLSLLLSLYHTDHSIFIMLLSFFSTLDDFSFQFYFVFCCHFLTGGNFHWDLHLQFVRLVLLLLLLRELWVLFGCVMLLLPLDKVYLSKSNNYRWRRDFLIWVCYFWLTVVIRFFLRKLLYYQRGIDLTSTIFCVLLMLNILIYSGSYSSDNVMVINEE